MGKQDFNGASNWSTISKHKKSGDTILASTFICMQQYSSGGFPTENR